MRTVLVVTSNAKDFDLVCQALGSGYRIDRAANVGDALKLLRESRHDLVYIDIDLILEMSPQNDVGGTLESLSCHHPAPKIVVMAPTERIRQAIRILRAGATDYITYPPVPDEVRLVAESVGEIIIRDLELDYLRDQFWQAEMRELVHTENAAMQTVFKKIQSVARTKATVMLIGETGTGKGVLAKLIHLHSNRHDAPFIVVHCGAIPETLLESELFGHEKGAFTGAHRKKLGKFEIARGGTMFLDEVGTIPAGSQIKLLQVLQDGTFSRVGGEDTIESDARIIAATNADLKQMSEEGSFRRDLYYRLNVFPIHLPPLRERREDIRFLINAFLKKFNQEYGKNMTAVHPHVLYALKNYHWPGNIRELENLMERAFILETSSVLTPECFPDELFDQNGDNDTLPSSHYNGLAAARKIAIEDFERHYLKELFTRNQGRVKKSADDAGITPRQLNKLMLKYGIHKEDYKN
ncbi:MAG: sigma-54 dependent transcriptional regulator [Desulfobacterales bacterium]